MSRLGQVASIFRYPVKTLQGELVDSIAVTELGFEGDRLWALRDEKRGDFGGEFIRSPVEFVALDPAIRRIPVGCKPDCRTDHWLAMLIQHTARQLRPCRFNFHAINGHGPDLRPFIVIADRDQLVRTGFDHVKLTGDNVHW